MNNVQAVREEKKIDEATDPQTNIGFPVHVHGIRKRGRPDGKKKVFLQAHPQM